MSPEKQRQTAALWEKHLGNVWSSASQLTFAFLVQSHISWLGQLEFPFEGKRVVLDWFQALLFRAVILVFSMEFFILQEKRWCHHFPWKRIQVLYCPLKCVFRWTSQCIPIFSLTWKMLHVHSQKFQNIRILFFILFLNHARLEAVSNAMFFFLNLCVCFFCNKSHVLKLNVYTDGEY